jgi:hypothetical protein
VASQAEFGNTTYADNGDELVVNINQLPPFKNLALLRDINDQKKIYRFEKLARKSYEYQRYFKYLKTNLDMRRCTYFPNITSNIDHLNVELHHCPFSMYDITKIVCNKHIIEEGFADEFIVCDEVMRLHYANIVGLVPVSPTVHKLINSESIEDVNPKLVYGNWLGFVKEYMRYFPDDIMDKYRNIEIRYNSPYKIPDMLDIKYTKIQYKSEVDNSSLTYVDSVQKMTTE